MTEPGDPQKHLCVDSWTPRSLLRARAGKLVDNERGFIRTQESKGTFNEPVLVTVFISGIDRLHYVSELRWLMRDEDIGEVRERRALFEHVYFPSNIRAVFVCSGWRSWLLSKLKERGHTKYPIKNGTCLEILCHLSCGQDSSARELLLEFVQVLLTAALETGWCGSEEQENYYDSQMKCLAAAVEKFSFKTPWKT